MPQLNDETKYKILAQLVENPQLSQRELANELGISLGKANYCLKALIDRGWIKIGNFRRSSNKKAYVYVLTPKGVEAKAKITLNFLKRKQQEYDELVRELERLSKEAMQLEVDGDTGVKEP